MADIVIRMEIPKNCSSCKIICWNYLEYGINGILAKLSTSESRDPNCPLVPLPEGHGELIERKALNLFPDYKEVRNGIKQTIKATERDGRTTTGVTIDLLKQTLVALDSLRSVRRYFLNAKTIVPADVTDNYAGSKSEEGETE